MFEPAELERELGREFEGRWVVSVTPKTPRPEEAPWPNSTDQKSAWGLGALGVSRHSLREVMSRLGEDLPEIRFPHPRYSLSHSGDCEVALGTDSRRTLGVGIDLERKQPSPGAAPRFLNPAECAWLARQDESLQPRAVQRLWTIKEAAFKADAENASHDLIDYTLKDPGEARGSVVRNLKEFRYLSVEALDGTLSIAVCLDRVSGP